MRLRLAARGPRRGCEGTLRRAIFSALIAATSAPTPRQRGPAGRLDSLGLAIALLALRLATRGVGQFVASKIEDRDEFEVRTSVLGHLQRGGSPSAHDRIWATRVGAGAYEAVIAGKFGTIPVVRDNGVVLAPLSAVAHGRREVPRELYDLCAVFF